MTAILNILLEITAYSVILFLAILIFKKVLHKHISAKLNYLVWMLLVLRLLMPFTLNSGFSIFVIPAQPLPIPLEQTGGGAYTANYPIDNENALQGADPLQQVPVQDKIQNSAETNVSQNNLPQTAPNAGIDWTAVAVFIWVSGIALSLASMFYLQVRFNRIVKEGTVETPEFVPDLLEKCKKDLSIRANIDLNVQNGLLSPGLTLALRPKLLLPSGMLSQMSLERIEYGIKHELTHFKRKDHIIRILLIILRSVYWFNPIVWLAFGRINTDMETACDAEVTAGYGREQRMHYVETIIFLSCDRSTQYALGMGATNGRKNIERRVEGIFMKKKTKAPVRMIAMLLAGLMLLMCFTTACQPTPAQQVVVNKNKDLVQEVQNQDSAAPSGAASQPAGTGIKLKDLVLPTSRYTFKSEDTAASLTINVDAAITKPEGDKMPFAKVKPMNFTQEMVTGMFNYLFPGQKPYAQRTQQTKSEIQNQILSFKKILAKGEFGDGEKLSESDKTQLNQQISDMEKRLETAPDEVPLVVSDGTLQKVTKTSKTGGQGMKTADGVTTATPPPEEVSTTDYELQVSLNKASLGIHTGSTGNSMGMDTELWYNNTDRNFSTDGMIRVNPGDALPQAAQSKLKLPLADAIAKADGFFKAAGVKDVKLFASYLVDDHGTGHFDNDWSSASHFAYELFYTRTVNGVPVSCNASEGTSGGEGDYAKSWFYETIEFLVSDDGIIEIHWMEPCQATEIVQDDCGLIDFDTAVKAFEKNAKFIYGQYSKPDENSKPSVDVKIDSIQLNLVRLREKDNPDERLYVPAYVFYGYVKQKIEYQSPKPYTYEGYMTSAGGGNDFYPGPIMVIAINAIDGSVIDTMKDVY